MRESIKDYKEKLSQWILSAYFKKKNIKFDIYIYIYTKFKIRIKEILLK